MSDGPPSRAGVTKKPSERRKVKVAAVASPRADSGNSTRLKVATREAPSPSLARNKAGSMRDERRVDRQHGIRQQHMHHADRDAGKSEQQRQRMIDDRRAP